MLIIKDTSVLIHLAKTTLLEISCSYFGYVSIPDEVMEEIRKHTSEDRWLIEDLLKRKKIHIERVKDLSLIRRANEYNIFGAEAHVVALYWELEADLVATDDYNVRKKKNLLKIEVIGTPGIVLKLYQEHWIKKDIYYESIQKLKKIGWFSNTVWDKLHMEAERNG